MVKLGPEPVKQVPWHVCRAAVQSPGGQAAVQFAMGAFFKEKIDDA
jgi:hypothetical protein